MPDAPIAVYTDAQTMGCTCSLKFLGKEVRDMDQSIVTFVLLGVLAVSLAASYVRHRGKESDAPGSAVNVKQTMAETRELLGLAPKGERGGLSDAFDLAPMQMLSDASASAKGGARVCAQQGGRRRKRG